MAEINKMAEVVVIGAGAGAGEKAAGATDDGSGVVEETTGRRRTKLVRVEQRYIDCLLKRTPIGPFRMMSDEAIDIIYETPEKRESIRTFQAETAALMKKVKDEEDAILEQYRKYGFAMQEVQVRDDDE